MAIIVVLEEALRGQFLFITTHLFSNGIMDSTSSSPFSILKHYWFLFTPKAQTCSVCYGVDSWLEMARIAPVGPNTEIY